MLKKIWVSWLEIVFCYRLSLFLSAIIDQNNKPAFIVFYWPIWILCTMFSFEPFKVIMHPSISLKSAHLSNFESNALVYLSNYCSSYLSMASQMCSRRSQWRWLHKGHCCYQACHCGHHWLWTEIDMVMIMNLMIIQ